MASLAKVSATLQHVDRSTRLCDILSGTKSDFIICTMLLMHWVDYYAVAKSSYYLPKASAALNRK